MVSQKTDYDIFKEEQLKDIEIKQAYEEEKIRAKIAKKISFEREKQRLTQRELARKANMQQSVIARIESVDYDNCTIKTLYRVGRALGKKIEIVFR